MSRLIDADALIMRLEEYFDKREKEAKYGSCAIHATWSDAIYHIRTAPTIEPPTTTWLGNYCPYKCEHCGKHTDSKTPYCAYCGRKAVNYDG